jgi:hypothetical protein
LGSQTVIGRLKNEISSNIIGHSRNVRSIVVPCDFGFFLYHQARRPSTTNRTNPPTTPPAIGPAFDFEPIAEVGSDEADGSEGDELELEAPPVSGFGVTSK